VFFIAKHSNTTAVVASGVATLYFVVAGTNKLSYNTPGTVSINVGARPTAAPVVTLTVTATAGNVAVKLQCDQGGIGFFALGLSNTTVATYSASSIKNKTMVNNVMETKVMPDDKEWKVFGY